MSRPPLSMKTFKPDPAFTFETFLHNQNNAFPVQTAKELIHSSFEQGNPFVLIGESGCGKSHLLKAMANCFHTHQIDDILLLEQEELLLHGQQAATNGGRFQDRLCATQLLLIDDFHVVTQNPLLQTELTTCFNKRLEDKLPTVVSCCGKVAEQPHLKSELISRLQAGLLVEVKKPDLDVRIAFLQQHNKKNRLGLSEKDCFDIATSCFDFKTIHEMLCSLLVSNELGGSQSDRQAVITQKLKHINNGPDCRKIMTIVAGHFQIQPQDLLSSKRSRTVVLARHIALYLCREMLGLTYAQLGNEFGGKHHSSVVYAIQKIKSFQTENTEINKMLKDLKQKCHHG